VTPLQSRFQLEAEREPAGRDIVMDVAKILAELKVEREQIEEAIVSLERLARGRVRGPGRPPNWMSDTMPKRRGRPPGSKNKAAAPARSSVAAAAQ
jgi:hypothetical protein